MGEEKTQKHREGATRNLRGKTRESSATGHEVGNTTESLKNLISTSPPPYTGKIGSRPLVDATNSNELSAFHLEALYSFSLA